MRPKELNAELARQTAEQRGNTLRGRGEGKTYPKLGGRHAHRVIAEQVLGRPLAPGEIVHHDNEVKSDYSPDNLKVLPSQGVHAAHHQRQHWTCTRDDCDRPHVAKGLCRSHYNSARRWKGGAQ